MVGDLIFAALVFADVTAFLWVALTLYLEPAPVTRRISLRAMARDAPWAITPVCAGPGSPVTSASATTSR